MNVNKIIKYVWLLYTITSFFFIVLSLVVFSGMANDLNTIRNCYQKTLNENRDLKKKLYLGKIKSQNFSNTTIIEATPTILITDSTLNKKENNNSDLSPWSDNTNDDNQVKIIELYGTDEDIFLGKVELNDYFSEPLEGSYIPGIEKYASCLPGAPRTYRSGFHQGVDMYSFDCGNPCIYGTNVFCIADGTIVRIDHDYKEMSSTNRGRYLEIMANISANQNIDTSMDLDYQKYFDLMRGRQIIVDHHNGIVSTYCHLSNVNENLAVGDTVKAGDTIGYLGNSGTSKGVEDFECSHVIGIEFGNDPITHQMDMINREWHLHLELWYCKNNINDQNFKSNYIRWNSFKKLFGY